MSSNDVQCLPIQSVKCNQVPSNTIKCHQMSTNFIKYYQMSSNAIKFRQVPSNTIQCHPIPSNTIQCNPKLSNALRHVSSVAFSLVVPFSCPLVAFKGPSHGVVESSTPRLYTTGIWGIRFILYHRGALEMNRAASQTETIYIYIYTYIYTYI